jgi:hypothetical protein
MCPGTPSSPTQSYRHRTTQRFPAAKISSAANREFGDEVKNRFQKARTAPAPSNRSPSGGGQVFSNTQSSVIASITPSTSCRLNASLNRCTASRVRLVSGSSAPMAGIATPSDRRLCLPTLGDVEIALDSNMKCNRTGNFPSGGTCRSQVVQLRATNQPQGRKKRKKGTWRETKFPIGFAMVPKGGLDRPRVSPPPPQAAFA